MTSYFISYAHTGNGNGLGFGSCQMNLDLPIRSFQDVQVVTRILREQAGVSDPVVLSFTRFDTDVEGGVPR